MFSLQVAAVPPSAPVSSEAWPLSTGPEAIEEFEEVPLSAAAGLMSTAGSAVMEEPAAGSEAWPLSTEPEAMEEVEEVHLSAVAGPMSTAGSLVMVDPAAEPWQALSSSGSVVPLPGPSSPSPSGGQFPWPYKR